MAPLVVRFSTADLPEHERAPILREVVGRTFVRLELEPVTGIPLHWEMVARAWPELTVTRSFCSQIRLTRTPQLMADGNDDVVLCLSPEAGQRISHLGRDCILDANTAVLLSLSDPTEATTAHLSRCTTISVPRKALTGTVPKLEDTLARELPKTEALQLLKSYIGILG